MNNCRLITEICIWWIIKMKSISGNWNRGAVLSLLPLERQQQPENNNKQRLEADIAEQQS